MQIENFWANDSEKENLQEVSRFFFQNRLTEHNRNDSSKCLQINNGVTNQRQDLDNHIEEAYMIIIPHISKSVESGLKK